MMSLLSEIYPLALGPVSEGADQAARILCRELPFKVLEYQSGRQHNGWTVPMKWSARKAEVRKDGRLIYDGTVHPLGVTGYSESFSGRLELAELKQHLVHHPRLDDALVYHCDRYYKPWVKGWGMSMPRIDIDALEDGEYEVDLVTIFEPGTMKVLDYTLKGEDERTVILNAHNCHAGQANDDVSGIVVAVEVMRRLRESPRRFTYKLIVAPEHLGTIFYLADSNRAEIDRMWCAIFLEMLGNENRMGLQESFNGDAKIDRAAKNVLAADYPDHEVFGFRRFVGNDETVWEAPGIEVPTISLCRYPYDQYHSDKDTSEIISPQRLAESVDIIMSTIAVLENDGYPCREFEGLIALSNPKYDLYYEVPDPSIRPTVPERNFAWNHLMNCIVRYFEGDMSILDIAEKHQLPFREVREYLERFEEKGLIAMRSDKEVCGG